VHVESAASNIAHPDVFVGISGTFDVENYGDLLFPLIAAAALTRRDQRMRVVPYSVTGKAEPAWPYQVRPVDELIASVTTLSAMLIGGGQLVRFDSRYPIPVPPNVALPIAYWLVPAALAALTGKPVIWNAVGAWTGSPRAPWQDELVRQVFAASYFIGVRDILTRDHLARLAPGAAIEFLPDTAFGLARLWPLEAAESVDFKKWRTSLRLDGKYVVIQASAAVGVHRATIESLVASMDAIATVILPVSWCHGDRAEKFPKSKRRVLLSREWLPPALIREIIARSEFVFASSLHACITALSYGVPAARAPTFSDRKYELLDEFDGIVRIDQADALRRLIRRGRQVEPRVIEYADRLDRYWDDVARVVRHPPSEHSSKASTVMLAWVAQECGSRGGFGSTRRLVMSMRESLARYIPDRGSGLHRRLYRLKHRALTTFRWNARAIEIAPVQVNGNGVASADRASARGILDLDQIARQQLETEPYPWASIDRSFSMADAAELAAGFPRDNFKFVKGNDGEKGYEFAARSLIHIGATGPSAPGGLSPAWQALVGDLLSAEYRSVLTRTTGVDLTSALIEANAVYYGPGAHLGPHLDLKEKVLSHVLYFNDTWDARDGGCLNILNSADPTDVRAEVLPLLGTSVLIVRSNRSWHSVPRVARDCRTTRRTINVIFWLPGSASTTWPPGERAALRDFTGA
jgi:hypothetical protein